MILRKISEHAFIEHLGSIEIPQGIAWEIPDHAAGPVYILENALCEGIGSYTQIFFILVRPQFRKRIKVHFSIDHHLLQFIADDDVKAVCELICFNSYERRLHIIHSLEYIKGRQLLKSFKGFDQIRIFRIDELLTSG